MIQVFHSSFSADSRTGLIMLSLSHFSPFRYKIVRGAMDLGGVAGRTTSRSKYGGGCWKVKRMDKQHGNS